MKKLLVLFGSLLSIFAFSACTETAEKPDMDEASDKEEVAEEAETPEEEPAMPEGPLSIDDLGLGEVSHNLEVGDFALAPSASNIMDEISDEDSDYTYLSYYAVEVLEVSDTSAKVKDTWGSEDPYEVDNSLIVPLKSSSPPAVGEVVLTWHQDISSLTRGLVLESGDEPKVAYLDAYWTGADTLPAGSFTVIDEGGVGSVVACKNDYDGWEPVTVLLDTGDQYLVQAWADVVEIKDKAECSNIPLVPAIAEGDTVYVAPFGELEEGTVTSIDDRNGLVYVEYEWAGETEEEKFPYGEIATELPQ
jgi:hypothetical protein